VADDFALGNGDRRFFKLPMLQTVFGDRTLYDLDGTTTLDERDFGVKLLATRLGKIEEELRVPSDWRVTNLPEPVEIDGPSAGLTFKAEAEPGKVRYTCELVIKKWTIPPDEYANFKEVLTRFDELKNHKVICETGSGHAQR
jgi:hypothetical protein